MGIIIESCSCDCFPSVSDQQLWGGHLEDPWVSSVTEVDACSDNHADVIVFTCVRKLRVPESSKLETETIYIIVFV